MEQLNLQERTGCVTSVGDLIGEKLPSIREALMGGTHNQPSPLPTQEYSSPKLGEVSQSDGEVCQSRAVDANRLPDGSRGKTELRQMRVSESRDCLQAMPSVSILEQASAWSIENGELKIKTDLLGCCATTPPNSGGEWWWTSHLPPNSPQLHDNSSPARGRAGNFDHPSALMGHSPFVGENSNNSSPKLGENSNNSPSKLEGVPEGRGRVSDLGRLDPNLNDLAKALKRGAYKTVQGEVSATKLYDTAPESIDTLVDPLLPRVGIVALVGSSDSGKSSLLRGLALAVSSGADQWLGLPLRTEHQRALYISTEDDEHSIGALLRKQNQELGLGRGDMAGLDFIFEADNPLLRTELTLNEKAVDLVVVDAFSDVYRGALNENNKVRAYLQEWSELAQKYQCLVIFLHHTGKRTEALLPSKHNSIGSQGFEAKMRLMMELRTDKVDSSLRHLCVVKGNYLGPEWKGKSFVLRFSPSLNYTSTGERVDFDELCHLDQSGEVSVVNESRKNDDEARYGVVMDMLAEGMTYQQIATALGLRSRSSVHRIIHK